MICSVYNKQGPDCKELIWQKLTCTLLERNEKCNQPPAMHMFFRRAGPGPARRHRPLPVAWPTLAWSSPHAGTGHVTWTASKRATAYQSRTRTPKRRRPKWRRSWPWPTSPAHTPRPHPQLVYRREVILRERQLRPMWISCRRGPAGPVACCLCALVDLVPSRTSGWLLQKK